MLFKFGATYSIFFFGCNEVEARLESNYYLFSSRIQLDG